MALYLGFVEIVPLFMCKKCYNKESLKLAFQILIIAVSIVLYIPVRSQRKMAVIVTHRLGLARFCDRIAVMKERKLVGLGSHEQLLQDSDYYRMLWEGQVSGYNA